MWIQPQSCNASRLRSDKRSGTLVRHWTGKNERKLMSEKWNWCIGFSRNTHSLTSMDVPWAGPQMASRDHKVHTTAVPVLTRSSVAISLKLTPWLVSTLEFNLPAPMLKSCPLNGNTKSVPPLAWRLLMISGFPATFCGVSLKSSESLWHSTRNQWKALGMEQVRSWWKGPSFQSLKTIFLLTTHRWPHKLLNSGYA